MAEFTLEQIRAAVRFRGDYPNVRKFPNADVDREIQLSFSEFYALVDKHRQGFWDTIGDKATVAAQGYVALPDACWKVKIVSLVEGTEITELDQVGPEAMIRFGTQTGRPLAYRLTARGADLYYTPDSVYTLRFIYTPRAPVIDATPRDYYNGWEDYVIESTLAKLDRRERKPISDRLAVLEAIEKRVQEEAGQRREQEPEYLRLREYELDIYGDDI